VVNIGTFDNITLPLCYYAIKIDLYLMSSIFVP